MPTLPLASVQVQAGCVLMPLPNWSVAVAENCWELPSRTVAVAGVSVILVTVWLTVAVAAGRRQSGGIGERDLERVSAGLVERRGRVLGRIGAVEAEGRRGRAGRAR